MKPYTDAELKDILKAEFTESKDLAIEIYKKELHLAERELNDWIKYSPYDIDKLKFLNESIELFRWILAELKDK